MKTFILNFIVIGLIAGAFWWIFIPSTLPKNIQSAFIGFLAFAVTIFSIAFTWIDYLFDEFRDRHKK